MVIEKKCPLSTETMEGGIIVRLPCCEGLCALWDASDLKCGILSISYEIARHRRDLGKTNEHLAKVVEQLKDIKHTK